MQRKDCCFLLLAHISFLTQQWNLHNVHFPEQIRLFHVGASVECVGFCALVPVRNPRVPFLCLTASTSNVEDEIYNTALRDKCMLVLIQVFFFFSTCTRIFTHLCCCECEFVAGFLSRNALQTVWFICLYFRKILLLLLFHHSPPSPAVKNSFASRVISGASLRIFFLSY